MMKYTHFIVLFIITFVFQFSKAQVCDSLGSVVSYDFNVCDAEQGIGNISYAEFQANINANSTCSSVGATLISRLNPVENQHSCVQGVGDGLGMCISPLRSCGYDSLSDKRLEFSVTLVPGPSGVAELSHIEFYEQAPRFFNWVDGASGFNNFPRKFAVRIEKNGTEIYRSLDNVTSRSWSKVNFDFSDNIDFRVFASTEFKIEILPYCVANNGYVVSVWDIDELSVFSCCVECPELDAGVLGPNQNVELCLADNDSNEVEFVVQDALGPLSVTVLTDDDDVILDFPIVSPYDFSNAPSGLCKIYNVVYDESLDNLELGANINNLIGCFDVSAPIEVIRNDADGGVITAENANNDVVFACNGDGNGAFVNVEVEGNFGSNRDWILTDLIGNIYMVLGMPPFDFEGTSFDAAKIWHISYDNGLVGLESGNNVADLMGCFDISNDITVLRSGVNGGMISIEGQTDLCILSSQSDEVFVDVVGEVGQRDTWLIADPSGDILMIPIVPPFDLSDLSDGNYQIWHVGHTPDFFGAEIGNNIDDLDGCFDLSNVISLNKNPLTAGIISTDDQTDICVGDGNDDLINVLISNASAPIRRWVVTDDAGVILELPNASPFNFEGAGAGICVIYNIGFEFGLSGLVVGQNIADLEGCFELSNGIVVNRTEIFGGVISTEDPLDICVGEGIDDSINVTLDSSIGAQNQWVITDSNFEILALPDASPFNFEGTESGVCLIWNVAYEGILEGAEIGRSALDLQGCYDLSNALTVNRTKVDGGWISTDDQTVVCAGEGAVDLIAASIEGATENSNRWVITTLGGLILDLPSSSPFNFEDAPTGTCLIWNLNFSGALDNLEVGNNVAEISGCYAFSNSIEVTRNSVNGGDLITNGPTTICTGDGTPDFIGVEVSNISGQFFKWIITDDQGNILDIPSRPPFNFESAGAGICQIWHIGHNAGIVGLQTGNNLSDIEGCFDLSNSITITRENVHGGNISTMESLDICIVHGESANLSAVVDNEEGSNSGWLVTDLNGNILISNNTGNFDFAMTGSGTSIIWHISYEDGIEGLMVGENANDLEGCFDLSNSLEVNPISINAGVISTNDLTSICTGDGLEDAVNVNLLNNVGPNSTFVVTSNTGMILAIQDENRFDFEGADFGTCFIWNISYESIDGLDLGANTSNLSGCFQLSNPIEITRTEVDGGVLTTEDPTAICTGDGNADIIIPNLVGNIGTNRSWVITDDASVILAITNTPPVNYENFQGGICNLWNISYLDDIDGFEIGNNLGDLSGCFDLSNPITIIRTEVDGGTIDTDDVTNTCSGDGSMDVINVNITGALGTNSTWLVTDQDGNILDRNSSGTFDFENAGPGVCFIWHLSFEDGASGILIGENTDNIQGCFDFSNSIRVVRDEISGGTISTSDDTSICSGDGFDDIIDVELEGQIGTSTAWVITDENGLILDVPVAPPFNFENAGAGICLIWSISFESGFSGLTIGNFVNDFTGCYALSNAITVTRVGVNGGQISTGDNTNICSGDDIEDIVKVELSGAEGANMIWVVTNPSGVILSLGNQSTFNFEEAGLGDCIIWHLSYEDGLLGLEEGLSINNLEGCVGVSNPIFVTREAVSGGSISTSDNTTVCSGDGVDDFVNISVMDADGTTSRLIITDENGMILDLPASNNLNFENAGAGICLVWNISYNIIPVGVNIGENISELEGCFDISNSVEVIREEVAGGDLSLINGASTVNLCIGDDEVDSLFVDLINNAGNFNEYLITDDQGNILAYPAVEPFTFENVPEGICLIWNISYNNPIGGLETGVNVSQLSGCFDLSNSVEVIRNRVEGLGASTATFTMDNCDARLLSLDNEDYSEFVADIVNPGECDEIEIISLNLYRENSSERIHSCTDGVNESPAICVSSLDNCTYQGGSDYAVYVDFSITPGASGLGLLSGISFYEQAPENFTFINGDSGPNNYPTRYGIRLYRDGNLVFEETEILTSRNYTLQEFDLTGIDTFSFRSRTEFTLELLPYCLVGNGAQESAWDIDNLQIISNCNNKIDAGEVFLESGAKRVFVCVDDGISDLQSFITNSEYSPYQFVITDSLNNVLAIPGNNEIDFEGGNAGTCRVWGIAYTGILTLEVGESLNVATVATDCFSLSDDFVNVIRLTGDDCPDSFDDEDEPAAAFTVNPNPAQDQVRLQFNKAQVGSTTVRILDPSGNVMKSIIYKDTIEYIALDISELNTGIYFIQVSSKKESNTQRFVKL